MDARGAFEALYAFGGRDVIHGTGRETFAAVKMLNAADPQPFMGARRRAIVTGP